MKREAKCSCGQLCIRVVGDPKIVAACSCLSCQRRTGSVFGVSSYFDNEQVAEISGESNSFRRTTESGRWGERYFCPGCGTTVYWKSELFPSYTGIPVGAFADPEFPEPFLSVWNQSKHAWVVFPEHWVSSDTQDIDPSLLLS
jgi:hypothetical protein